MATDSQLCHQSNGNGTGNPSALEDRVVLFGSNPNSTNSWSEITGRTHDLMHDHFEPCPGWSLRCNRNRIESGTIGLICYSDGSHGRIAGVHVLNGDVYDWPEANGTATIADGTLWRLPAEYQIDRARIRNHRDWTGRDPFGPVKQFANGPRLRHQIEVDLIWELMDPFVADRIRMKSTEVAAR